MAASVKTGNDANSSPKRPNTDKGSYPKSPLGATPRRPLPQQYDIPYSSLSFSRDEFSRECQQAMNHSNSVLSHKTQRNSLWSPDYTKGKITIGPDEEDSTKSFVILGLVFVSAVIALLTVYLNFPKLEEHEKQYIQVPKHIEDAKHLGQVLSNYKDKYYFQVIGGYFLTYIFLQTFAIPGSIFLSILSGYLFPFYLAISLVCTCSAIGASFCYLLFYLVGRKLVLKYFPERVAEWSGHVNRHREHLLNYIIFLRITPFLPNWFINITSPVIGVPLLPFIVGTFLGVAPPSIVAIQAGTTLHELTSSRDALSVTSVTVLAVLAILSLLPVIFKKKLKEKFD